MDSYTLWVFLEKICLENEIRINMQDSVRLIPSEVHTVRVEITHPNPKVFGGVAWRLDRTRTITEEERLSFFTKVFVDCIKSKISESVSPTIEAK
jgi:hypothetical protein